MPNELTSQNPETTRASLIATWLLQQGLDGVPQHELLQGYCQKLVGLGIPLMRLHVAQRAFHPVYGGIGFDWHREAGVSQERYEHASSPQRWMQSPLYFMLDTSTFEFRRNLSDLEKDCPYPLLVELKQAGGADYLAMALLFERRETKAKIDPLAPPEGALVSWSSDAKGGFTDDDLVTIKQSLPALGLALKSVSNRQIATDLLGVYLGADAGKRVLSGEIQRGSLQQITAVICYFDLTGFTSLTEETPGDALITMLNDYFGTVVPLIEANGGNVLKFMGDGLLAIFGQDDLQQATRSALNSATEIRTQMRKTNVARKSQGLPFTNFTLALHLGEVWCQRNTGSHFRSRIRGNARLITAADNGMIREKLSWLFEMAVRSIWPKEKPTLAITARYM